MSTPTVSERSTAAFIARCLKARGIDRVFALCGGHIMPIWMRLDAEGIRIIDVRDERAAVYMAHAHAELTGQVGVALVTAGPGVTNAMTGIANAHVARASVLILSGTPPRAQENRGALQDMVHTEFVKPLTRYARTVREPDLVMQELDEALARAQGIGSEPGPVYLDFPVDTLRAQPSAAMQMPEWMQPRRKPVLHPDEIDGHALSALMQQLEIRMLAIDSRATPHHRPGVNGNVTAINVYPFAIGFHVHLLNETHEIRHGAGVGCEVMRGHLEKIAIPNTQQSQMQREVVCH